MHVSQPGAIIFISTLAVIYGQYTKDQDDCRSQETCGACIRIRNCTWCNIVIDEHVEKSPVRCVNLQDPILDPTNEWCAGGTIVNETTSVNLVQNDPLGSGKGIKVVQIQPQIVNLKLRRGEEYNLKVRYRQAKDYPVDLYFLVDLSNSMKRSREDLGLLTNKIVSAMKNLTSDFQLGFGTFVDKKIRPMINDGSNKTWEGHDAFKNHLSLTNLYVKFNDTVFKTHPVGSALDHPEGGMDGMMQAIVCTEQIGWRSNARHLLVHATDNVTHIAGDGRLAGLVNPNDEKCHLENGTGVYTHGELQDYPSLGQINWQARKNNINIIFASFTEDEDAYKELQHVIENSAVGVFDLQTEAIVPLISGQYEKLARTIKMTSNSTSNLLSVEFFSNCLIADEKPQLNNECNNSRINVTIDFDVVIKALNCSDSDEDWHQIIEIKPEGINERVIVNVEMICGCECSKKIDKGGNASRSYECHNNGILDCGACSCDKGHYGKTCQCTGDKDLVKTDPFMNFCRKDNSSEICSGRGRCMCGNCNCGKRPDSEEYFRGDFCECNDLSCRQSKYGKLCEGNGRCECDTCKCDLGWSGSTCGCRENNSLCIRPGDDAKICSNAGKCECGKCKCDSTMGRNGKFCEDCLSCPGQRCEEFKDCVECRVHESGKIYAVDPYCLECTEYDIHLVDEIEEDPDKIKPGEHVCRVADNDGTTFVFMYVYLKAEDKDPRIYAKKEKESGVDINLLAATLGVILLTLIIGLVILLIWKMTTHMQDKREFEKFEKERAQVYWAKGQNPLYKTAVTTFNNPIFDSTLEDEVVITLQQAKK